MVTPDSLCIMIMFAALEVGDVGLMSVGFLLEADMAVSLHTIAVLHEKHQPLHHIPDEEWDVKQFPLLGHVYQLMIELRLAQLPDRKDKPTQADGNELLAHRMPLYQKFLVPHWNLNLNL